MKCPNCHIPVRPYYMYCPSCGMNLQAQRGTIWDILFILIAIGVISGGIFFLFNKDTLIHKKAKNSVKESKTASASSKSLFAVQEPSVQSIKLMVGTIVIDDIAGNMIATMPAAVSASGWVAIPEKLCVGGYNWYFRFNNKEQADIIGGIIGDYDEVGIWQLKNMSQNSDIQISSGNMDQPFKWASIISDKTYEIDHPSIQSEQQNFYRISFFQAVQEPGVFIQNNKIVGWSFGDKMEGGFIWKGTDESNLVFELTVSDFYRITFENSREEQFILSYAQGGKNPVKELEYFAKGFVRAPKLSAAATPARLKRQAVISEMRSLVSNLISSGDSYNISQIFDSNLLARIGDVDLLIDVINGVIQNNGFESGADIVDGVIRSSQNFNKTEINQIRQFQKDTYKQWLTALVDQRDYSKAIDVYDRAENAFVDDPEIHIQGVKLALSFNDWKLAGRILNSHQFPLDFADQVKTLEDQIASMKPAQYQEENKIVIHFAPGSNRIPVSAVINQSIDQNFIVDTGASMVTIPTEAVKRLGIDVKDVPVHHLVTASGVIIAPEITLDSIQIGGWTEKNVKAFIMDMPDQSGAGLLGLNYLHRFRMELNTQGGILTLTPR